MAHNEIEIGVGPERVFAVLADPRSYARWVVGSREIRKADPEWPAVGSAFDHKVGVWPFVISDHSSVVECAAPSSLKLLVKARPLSRAYVTLQLEGHDGRTRVSMDEHAADMRSKLLFNRLTDPLVEIRNRVSLRRLKALSEGSEPIPEGRLPRRDSRVEGHVRASGAGAGS